MELKILDDIFKEPYEKNVLHKNLKDEAIKWVNALKGESSAYDVDINHVMFCKDHDSIIHFIKYFFNLEK